MLLKETPVVFPNEKSLKVKLMATEKFAAIRNIALQNAANTNTIPASYRDFYMDSTTKKLLPWARLFESRQNKNGFKSVESSRSRILEPIPLALAKDKQNRFDSISSKLKLIKHD